MNSVNVAIEDHKGVERQYALRRLPAGLAVARMELTSATGKVYEVRLERGGRWICECPAWLYRNAKRRVFMAGTCKHIVEARRAYELVLALMGPEVTP